jgi:hypothetical protein
MSLLFSLLMKSWVATYGEDSDFVRTRIKGEFQIASVALRRN